MPMGRRQYVFGPVPSRRLGRSLGIDLVPLKTCTFDCVYCQLGRTTTKTLERKEYVPVGDVLGELRGALSEGPSPDYVTLSGSGEPTLHSGLEELVAGIKSLTTVPLAVLTNGSLLSDPDVRCGLQDAEVVIPSLDAGDDEIFRRVNRPHGDLSFARILEGLEAFRSEFRNAIWLEVFLLAGVTDSQARVGEIARLAARAGADRIQLNTVQRPPAEKGARPVPSGTLERLAALFSPRAEVITELEASKPEGAQIVAPADVLALLSRRPCTAEDIAEGLGTGVAEVVKWLSFLEASGAARLVRQEGRSFYVVPRHHSPAEGWVQ
jgi:wyosine [tRNA(Phe)-imidazoG37] synthetase (radical SAM superfamily)